MKQPNEAGDGLWNAILLIGLTGSGKTPLGSLLEKEGLWAKPCLHFDFGEALRAGAQHGTGHLTHPERDIVKESLRSGALLENAHFAIARKLLTDFLVERGADGETLLVLNGIPRHTGQAGAMRAIVKAQAVVSLECGTETVLERIMTNAGGDRDGRADDTLEQVEQRMELFRKRTTPLLNYYRKLGVPVLVLEVGAETTPQELRLRLEASRPGITGQAKKT